MAKPLAACLTKQRMCRNKFMFVVKVAPIYLGV